MSRTLRSFFACLLLIALPALAAPICPPPPTQPSPAAVQEAMQHARDRGFLWRISKDGRDSWLYGTIHVAKFDWMFPGPQVMQAVQDSGVLALELDMLDPDIRQRMAAGMRAVDAAPALPPELVRRLREQAQATCLPYEAIARYPAEIQLTTLTLMKARLDGLEAAYAVDAVLAGMGHGAQKQVVSLETPESQFATLKIDDPQELLQLMDESLAEMEHGKDRKQLRHIAQVWASSDYDELARYEEWCECMESPTQRRFMHKLLDERNPALAERIDALHQQGNQVFAAVGSLHMFGERALPRLLEQRGYRVERIDFPQ
ncbi:MAG: TraB/GumN family protein [Pseudomonadota bacterium]